MKYTDLVDVFSEKHLDMKILKEVSNDAMEFVKNHDFEMFSELMDKLYAEVYKIDENDAQRLVRAMKPYGEFWTMEQVKNYLYEKGIKDNCTNWYLVMNMVRNDYDGTAKAFDLSGDTEFFFQLAKDFITDQDAKPYKVERYFM